MDDEVPWEGQVADATWSFAKQCADLARSNPYDKTALDWIINYLMTELWDNGFSQTEIRKAFQAAIVDMPRYAGE